MPVTVPVSPSLRTNLSAEADAVPARAVPAAAAADTAEKQHISRPLPFSAGAFSF